MKTVILFFALIFSINHFLVSQCTPASETSCEDAKVLCSLTELNGFTCRLSSASNTTGCMPICPSGGSPENIEWWAFTSEGGNVTISLTISNCTNTTGAIGMEFGLSGNCNCSESVACNRLCNGPGTYTISATLTACKTYYLFIDGCNGDLCDYTIQTSGGNAPNLFPLGKINDDADGIISLCRTRDTHQFHAKPPSNGCIPNYEWTLDGINLGVNSYAFEYEFPEEGDFQLCVTSFIGDPQKGSICDQEGPVCATIQIRQIPDKTSGVRYLCPENIPYKWYDQYIIDPGLYRTELFDKQYCYFDSVVQFQILLEPIIPKIYHIGCNSADVFIDPTSRKVFKTCQSDLPILIKKSTDTYKCDSTYELTAIFLDHEVTFKEDCQDGKIIIQPRILNKAITCGGNEIFEYRYKWYLKQDTNKTSISTDEYYTAIQKNDYCLEIELITTLGPLTKTCFFDYCENLDESIYIKPSGKFSAYKTVCSNDTSCITFKPAYSGIILGYEWDITGGTIINPNPSQDSSICVVWNLPPGQKGKACVYYKTLCDNSQSTCIDVNVGTSIREIAGPSKTVKGLTTNLEALLPGGTWRKVSGPGFVTFSDPFKPNIDVRVSKYGIYTLSWSVKSLGCITVGYVTIRFIRSEFKGRLKNQNESFLKYDPDEMISPQSMQYHISKQIKNQTLSLQLSSTVNQTAKVSLIDLSGKIVAQSNYSIGTESQSYELLTNTSSGIYFLTIQTEHDVISERIVITD
ncbi:MAG: T9SS type A sorting domain-containing protein [Saprospiraceae bacterium]|uniref:T9SS type A sorting domain-containing protein n=1 Tax=Candidatus Defluviibacterium haderslevense TaxID=2981993 RepID=A0A9D7XDI8_9BACT|nr:T9SS type A sorting domain-containing protein [Candidatus Defluviibacterium haderslevense]